MAFQEAEEETLGGESGSAVDIVPDVKTQMSQRWFWSPVSQQRRRNDAAITVKTPFRLIWRRQGAV